MWLDVTTCCHDMTQLLVRAWTAQRGNIMGVWHQTKYLLRKNFHIKKRNKRETLQELLIPIWWIIILIVIKLGVKMEEQPAIKEGDITGYPLNANSSASGANSYVANTNATVGVVIASEVSSFGSELFGLLSKHSPSAVSYMRFNTTTEMIDYYRENDKDSNFGAGIYFWKADDDSLAYTLFVREENFPDLKTQLVGPGKWFRIEFPATCGISSFSETLSFVCIPRKVSLLGSGSLQLPSKCLHFFWHGRFASSNRLCHHKGIFSLLLLFML